MEEAVAAALQAAWPPTSPYLSPVEHLLDVLDKQVQSVEALQLTVPKDLLLILVSDTTEHL